MSVLVAVGRRMTGPAARPARACAGAFVLALLVVSGCGEPPGGPAVVLATLDTVSADHVGAYGDPGIRTPFLDRAARRGIQVRDGIAPTPLTAPSHATMLTGLTPPRHGVRENGRFSLAPGVLSVAEAAPEGVPTGAFVAAVPLLPAAGLDRGFDMYDAEFGTDPGGAPRTERPAPAVLERAAAWISGRGRPAFAWVHLFDAHYPWDPPGVWARAAATTGGEPYDAEIAFLDRQLGRFLRGLPPRSSVLIVGDHGESRGAHGEITHGFFVYDATQRVPLIWNAPDEPARIETAPRSIGDVAPTLCRALAAAAGTSGHVEAAFGTATPLQEPAGPPSPIYLESRHAELLYGMAPLHAARTERWKYVRAPRPELYDLRNDPGETNDVRADHAEIVSRLDAWVDRERAREPAAGSAPLRGLSAEAAEGLRALGYLAGSGERSVGGAAGTDPKDGIELATRWFNGLDAIRSEDWARAVEELGAAVRLAPDHREMRHQLARAQLGAGDAPAAAETARRALELRPVTSEAELRVLLGRALIAAGRPAEALPHLELAARYGPDREETRKALAEANALLDR